MNNDWLKHYKGFEELAKRFDDQVERVVMRGMTIVTPFLNENEQEILKRVAGNRCQLFFDGGYAQAEKKRAVMTLYEEAPSFEIVQLKAAFSKAQHPTHRDCMGALYNSGARNDQFGDIVLLEDAVVVFVSESIAQHICMNTTSIGRSKVTFKENDEALQFEKQMKITTHIVASTRLDSIVSSITHLSRAKAQDLIRSKCVQVNHLPLEDCSALCNNNCILSIRGYGRFKFLGVTSKTRKEKVIVEIGVYQ